MPWDVEWVSAKPKLKNPVLIEGLPGIGNVGKIVADFAVERLKPQKLCSFVSNSLPHSVFVNEESLVQLPSIDMYSFHGRKGDFLFLVGDVQPIDEVSCYEFCYKVLEIAKSFGVKRIITIGGIGLEQVPKSPKIYCTGSSPVKDFAKGTAINTKLYGIVGPIMGVSGLLVGLAGKARMEALCLLAETYGHPLYLGIKGAREILKILNSKYSFGLDLKELDKQIAQKEKEAIRYVDELAKSGRRKPTDTSYIG